MPDLTIENFRACETARNFKTEVKASNGKDSYVVTYGPSNGPFQHDWHCTCTAFKFGKGKKCKHISIAAKRRCGWDEMFDSCEVIDNKCPKCGEETFVFSAGV